MKKYKKGELITSLDELMVQTLIIQEFNPERRKTVHSGWFGSWQIRYAMRQIQSKQIYKAVKVKEKEQ